MWPRRHLAALFAAVLVGVLFVPAVQPPTVAGTATSVIVRAHPGSTEAAERLVEAAGGTVGRSLAIIDGFAADVPHAALARLAIHPSIFSITANGPLELLADRDDEDWRQLRDRGNDRSDRDEGRERDEDDDDDDDRDEEDWRQLRARGNDRDGGEDEDRDRDEDADDDEGRERDEDDDDRGRDEDQDDDDDEDRDDDDDEDRDEDDDDDPGRDEDDDDDRDEDDDDDDRGRDEDDLGSMRSTAKITGADRYWAAGLTGQGVDVAIIDSGVSPVLGLSDPGKVVRGPDISFESQAPNLRYLDSFGHGTFMAGLIGAEDPGGRGRDNRYAGIAPDARIISIKVANARGATDVSQVIAAIDWVVQHRNDPGLNIRVLNLSFGTYGAQPYTLDPLAFAAEVAWHAGIFVVVSAGNNAPASGRLMNPAMDPFVMAVGAADPNGTMGTKDDLVLPSSAHGDGVRNPDLVAPGRSLHGLRVPGSFIDLTFPGGRISDRYFRGSGTSQAAAIVSGAAALVIQQRPGITADQLKALLVSTAQPLRRTDGRAQGAGLLDLAKAFRASTPRSVQPWPRSTGTGSLELARGGNHPVHAGVVLEGERDIFGAPFDSASHAAAALAGTTWSGGTWNGSVWTGNEWSANEWSTVAWTAMTWSGNEWSANEWSANEWSANEWSANEWSGNEWSANEWSANEWSANEWSTEGWQSAEWPFAP